LLWVVGVTAVRQVNVVAPSTDTETSSSSLHVRWSERVGVVLAVLWLPIDWKNGLNLGQLGFLATFFFAPIGMFIGANTLGHIRQGRPASRALARWTLALGALGTTFAFCLLATR
jgi:hypothetical protein